MALAGSRKSGRSPVLGVSERAHTVVVRGAEDREIARLPLRIVPGEVVTLRL